jgi:HK97 family phage portal protein
LGIKTALQRLTGNTSIEKRGDPLNNPSIPLSAAGFLSWAFSGEPTASGEQVNVHTAMQDMTVQACLKILTQEVSTLPIKVYELIEGQGKKECPNHPLATLLGVSPNDEMQAVTFWDSMVGALILTGNCYAEIQTDAVGRAVAIWPLSPMLTEPKRDDKGNLVYETTDGEIQGKSRIIPSDRMFHVPLFSFDGLKGYNPIHLARQGIGLSRATEKYGAKWFGNGGRPGGLLTSQGTPTPAQMTSMRESWERSQGVLCPIFCTSESD